MKIKRIRIARLFKIPNHEGLTFEYEAELEINDLPSDDTPDEVRDKLLAQIDSDFFKFRAEKELVDDALKTKAELQAEIHSLRDYMNKIRLKEDKIQIDILSLEKKYKSIVKFFKKHDLQLPWGDDVPF